MTDVTVTGILTGPVNTRHASTRKADFTIFTTEIFLAFALVRSADVHTLARIQTRLATAGNILLAPGPRVCGRTGARERQAQLRADARVETRVGRAGAEPRLAAAARELRATPTRVRLGSVGAHCSVLTRAAPTRVVDLTPGTGKQIGARAAVGRLQAGAGSPVLTRAAPTRVVDLTPGTGKQIGARAAVGRLQAGAGSPVLTRAAPTRVVDLTPGTGKQIGARAAVGRLQAGAGSSVLTRAAPTRVVDLTPGTGKQIGARAAVGRLQAGAGSPVQTRRFGTRDVALAIPSRIFWLTHTPVRIACVLAFSTIEARITGACQVGLAVFTGSRRRTYTPVVVAVDIHTGGTEFTRIVNAWKIGLTTHSSPLGETAALEAILDIYTFAKIQAG